MFWKLDMTMSDEVIWKILHSINMTKRNGMCIKIKDIVSYMVTCRQILATCRNPSKKKVIENTQQVSIFNSNVKQTRLKQ